MYLYISTNTLKKKKKQYMEYNMKIKNISFFGFIISIIMTLLFLISSCKRNMASAQSSIPPKTTKLTDYFPHLSLYHNFSDVFGGSNFQVYGNGSSANISLTNYTGSGFASNNHYYYGFFSAAIKLPAGVSSGVVLAFYLTNSDLYPRNHDEIDFELLGHEENGEWMLQTNMYGNGSVSTGREEKFRVWFDPSADFHYYTILWNSYHIVYLVDNVPIREIVHTEAITSVYPSKPMAIFATIWDGSNWATRGGKYPVEYGYAPFVASFSKMEISGCIFNPNENSGQPTCSNSTNPSSYDPIDGQDFIQLSDQQIQGLKWARNNHMVYSYCNDTRRYSVPLPECTS